MTYRCTAHEGATILIPGKTQITDETLDPQDWDGMRQLAHTMVDDMLGYLQTVRERPIWQPIPQDVKARFDVPVPHEGQAAEDVYDDFLRDVLPYPMGNIHPRFWAWVMGNGTPLTVMADMLAATVNSNLGGGEHAATYVESQTINWCKEMVGYSANASGLLVSGGSMANLVGLTTARNVKAGYDVRKQGIGGRRLMFYASQETHSCIQRGLEVLGLGSDSLHKVAVNDDYTINLEALEAAVAADRAAGHQPICIVGNAGTVNTGAYDDLNALADICEREGLWFHVDGAIGALTRLAPELATLTDGMERADSLAVDLHKWLHIPFEAGCALVRHADQHYHTFTLTPDYLKHNERGLASGERWFSDFGIQLSRGFRALKVWMSIKEQGIDKLGRLIVQNVRQAAQLRGLVLAHDDLEILAPTISNIVCFRYHPRGTTDEATWKRLNSEIAVRLQEAGHTVVMMTTVRGVEAIRVCFNNHRTTDNDIHEFVDAATATGAMIAAEWGVVPAV
jgi:aromatic-L-amino-acid/L-tryptophan decarboxylase